MTLIGIDIDDIERISRDPPPQAGCGDGYLLEPMEPRPFHWVETGSRADASAPCRTGTATLNEFEPFLEDVLADSPLPNLVGS